MVVRRRRRGFSYGGKEEEGFSYGGKEEEEEGFFLWW